MARRGRSPTPAGRTAVCGAPSPTAPRAGCRRPRRRAARASPRRTPRRGADRLTPGCVRSTGPWRYVPTTRPLTAPSPPSPLPTPAVTRPNATVPSCSMVTRPWFSNPLSTGSPAIPSGSATTSPTARGPVPFTVATSRSPTPSWRSPSAPGKLRPTTWKPAHTANTTAPPATRLTSVPSSMSEREARTWGPSSPPPRQ